MSVTAPEILPEPVFRIGRVADEKPENRQAAVHHRRKHQ